MQIPLVDLYAQYQTIKHEITATFEDVLESMQLFLGPQTQAFENEFAAYCGCRYGIGISSGTDALVLALRACDIGPGDEVSEPEVAPHTNVPAPAVGTGEKNQRGNTRATTGVLAGGEAFGAGMVGALDYAAALLESVVRAAPPPLLQCLLEQLERGQRLFLYGTF